MTTQRLSALAIATLALSVLGTGCSSTTDNTSSGGSGTTSGGSNTSGGTNTSGGATSSGSSSSDCSKSSICINGSCKCGAGPNKDKSCQDETASGADYCDTYCYYCK